MANVEPSIFEDADPETDARRAAEAEADIAAGRVIPNAAIIEGLSKVGTPDEQAMPESWLK